MIRACGVGERLRDLLRRDGRPLEPLGLEFGLLRKQPAQLSIEFADPVEVGSRGCHLLMQFRDLLVHFRDRPFNSRKLLSPFAVESRRRFVSGFAHRRLRRERCGTQLQILIDAGGQIAHVSVAEQSHLPIADPFEEVAVV